TREVIGGAHLDLFGRGMFGEARPSAVSDATGRFRFDALAREEYAVSVTAPGYLRQARTSLHPGEQVEVLLAAGGGRIRGTVTGADGRPVPNLRVLIESEASDQAG